MAASLCRFSLYLIMADMMMLVTPMLRKISRNLLEKISVSREVTTDSIGSAVCAAAFLPANTSRKHRMTPSRVK